MSGGYLFFDPNAQPLSPIGTVMPGCYLQFYLTTTVTLTPIYANAALSSELSNPVIADATGTFPAIYLNPAVTYRVQLYDPYGNLLHDNDPFISSNFNFSATQTSLGLVLYPQTTAEIAASVVPTNYYIPATNNWAYIGRYGGNLTQAVAVASTNQFTIFIDYVISTTASITVPNNVTLSFIGSGQINQGGAYTLSVNGPVIASNTFADIFTGGTISVNPTSSCNWSLHGALNLSGGGQTIPYNVGNSGTAFTIDCSKSNVFYVSMTGNVVGTSGFTILNPQLGQTINIQFYQNTTPYTFGISPWPTNFYWAGGIVPVLTTGTAGIVDVLVMLYSNINGSNIWYATLLKGFTT
jgi:hypothetical protein